MSANIYDSTTKVLIPYAGNSQAEPGPLENLENVDISSPTDGQVLVYDGTATEWKNVSADSTPTSGSSNLVTSGGVYTAVDGKVDKITGKGLSANDFTDALKDKLDDIEPNAEVNVQADWSETDTTDDAFIANKPTLGTAAAKDSTDRVSPNNTALVESQSVYSAINTALSSIYTPRGDITCAELTSELLISDNVGNIYEVSDSGTTTALFLQGAGHPIAIGSNVGIISAGQGRILFNLMANAFDLTSYQKIDLTQVVEGETTVEDALEALSDNKQAKTLTTPITVDGVQKTTVEDTLGALNTLAASNKTNKTDKVTGATNGNFAGLNASGNITDSGKKASDFATPADIKSVFEVMGIRGSKNMLQYPYRGVTQGSGVTFTDNGDGSITANGTVAAGIDERYSFTLKALKLIPGREYIITTGIDAEHPAPASNKYGISVVLYNGSTYTGLSFNTLNATEKRFTAPTDVAFDSAWSYLFIYPGTTVTNLTMYPMLRLAEDTDDTYEMPAKTNKELTDLTADIQNKTISNGPLVIGDYSGTTIEGLLQYGLRDRGFWANDAILGSQEEPYHIDIADFQQRYTARKVSVFDDESSPLVSLGLRTTDCGDWCVLNILYGGSMNFTGLIACSPRWGNHTLFFGHFWNGEWYGWRRLESHVNIGAVLNKYGAKNLIPFPYYDGMSKTSNGITYTVNSDGSVKVNGTATAISAFDLAKGVNFGNTSIYSYESENMVIGNYVILTSGLDNGGDADTIFFRYDKDTKNTSIVVKLGAVIDNVTVYPMIRDWNFTENTYQPYAMTNRELTRDMIYSTSETDTGKRWIDGKKIYRKTYTSLSLQTPSSNVWNSFSVAPPANAGLLIKTMIIRNDKVACEGIAVKLDISGNDIKYINPTFNASTNDVILTIEYTKTT